MSHDLDKIRYLLAIQCHRLDRGSADEVAALFAEDAVLYPRFDGDYRVKGRDAIRQWYAYYENVLRKNVRHLRHMLQSVALDLEAEGASSLAYFTAAFLGQDGRGRLAYGLYTDRLVKRGEAWLFQEHVIDASFTMSVAETTEESPPLGYPSPREAERM